MGIDKEDKKKLWQPGKKSGSRSLGRSFHVVNDRHLRKRPMIFTTNKPLIEWGKVLHDEDLAAAILDRVLERGRLIHLDGPSGRTRHLNLDRRYAELNNSIFQA